jgi:hypothetical protein
VVIENGCLLLPFVNFWKCGYDNYNVDGDQCGYSNFNIDGDHGILVINVRDVLGIVETLEELAQGPTQDPPDAL